MLRVANETHAERVHIIAHSMGNRALTNALNMIGMTTDQPLFQQVILAAPDVDKETFEQIDAAVASSAQRVTIYGSENDQALKISLQVHGNPRLGQTGEHVYISDCAKTQTICTKRCESSLGHSSIGEAPEVISHTGQVLNNDFTPKDNPRLREVLTSQPGKVYFQFQ